MTEDTYKQLFYNSPVPMYIFDDKTFDFYAVNEVCNAAVPAIRKQNFFA